MLLKKQEQIFLNQKQQQIKVFLIGLQLEIMQELIREFLEQLLENPSAEKTISLKNIYLNEGGGINLNMELIEI